MRGKSLTLTLILATLIAAPVHAAPMTPTLTLATPAAVTVPAGGDEIALPLNATYTIEAALKGTVTLDSRVLAHPAWAIARITPETVTIDIQPGVRTYKVPFSAFVVASRDAPAHAEDPLSVRIDARETPLYGATSVTKDILVRAGYRGDLRGHLSSVTADAGVTTVEIALENAGNGATRVVFEENGRVPGVKVVLPRAFSVETTRTEPMLVKILAHVEAGSPGGVVKLRATTADASHALTRGNALDFAFEVDGKPVEKVPHADTDPESTITRDTPALPTVGIIAGVGLAGYLARRGR